MRARALSTALIAACACSSSPTDSGSHAHSGGAGGGAATGGGGQAGAAVGGGGGGSGTAGAAGAAGSAGSAADACADAACSATPCIALDCSVTPCQEKYDSKACDYPVPSSVADRFGLYAWGFAKSASGGEKPLGWAEDRISEVGSRTLRVALGPDDSYGANPPGAFSLVAAASSPEYAALFGDSRFDVVLLTTYSAGDYAVNFLDGYSQAEADAERTEIADLAKYLLATYSNKTFVILNWEGDNQLAGHTDDAAWNGFHDWIATRAAAVGDAVLAVPTTSSQIYSGLEFNRVENCGTERCVVSDVAPFVDVNYYSYSSYESINVADATGLAQSLKSGLDQALGFVQAKRPEVGPERFIVGELGFAREVPYLGECEAASRTAIALSAIESWGAARGIYWQIADNPLDAGFYSGFGLYKANGTTSLEHSVFADLYATGTPSVPAFGACPVINQGGVVSGVTHDSTIVAGETLEIYGTGFDGNDSVLVRQNLADHVISAGSPYFYDSPQQINATLPAAIGAGQALVWIRRGDGVESNGQLVVVLP